MVLIWRENKKHLKVTKEGVKIHEIGWRNNMKFVHKHLPHAIHYILDSGETLG